MSWESSLGNAGWLFYWMGSVGYLLSDALASHAPDWLFLFLALIFLFDALLYFFLWHAVSSSPSSSPTSSSATSSVWMWSEVVYVLASLFAVAAAALFLVDLPRESALAAQVGICLFRVVLSSQLICSRRS
jgi:hypothetical protein